LPTGKDTKENSYTNVDGNSKITYKKILTETHLSRFTILEIPLRVETSRHSLCSL